MVKNECGYSQGSVKLALDEIEEFLHLIEDTSLQWNAVQCHDELIKLAAVLTGAEDTNCR